VRAAEALYPNDAQTANRWPQARRAGHRDIPHHRNPQQGFHVGVVGQGLQRIPKEDAGVRVTLPGNSTATRHSLPLPGHTNTYGIADFTTRQEYVGSGLYICIKPQPKRSWGIE
jgi:hypothetical protein